LIEKLGAMLGAVELFGVELGLRVHDVINK
jgi:hypothetical protein